MGLEKRYQTVFGTETQIAEIKSLTEQFDTIKATVLEHKVVLLRTTPNDHKQMHYYEVELNAPVQDLNKYFELLREKKDALFSEINI